MIEDAVFGRNRTISYISISITFVCLFGTDIVVSKEPLPQIVERLPEPKPEQLVESESTMRRVFGDSLAKAKSREEKRGLIAR